MLLVLLKVLVHNNPLRTLRVVSSVPQEEFTLTRVMSPTQKCRVIVQKEKLIGAHNTRVMSPTYKD